MPVCLETEVVVKGGEFTDERAMGVSKQLPGYSEPGGIILMYFWVLQQAPARMKPSASSREPVARA
jgi:hypothetical protein